MPATIYYEQDADLGQLAGRTVAVMGYGSQGHAHALNLRDSGVDVVVGLREGSASRPKAESEGLRVADVASAAAEADITMMALPDTDQAAIYDASIAPNLKRATPSPSRTASTSTSARSTRHPMLTCG